MEDNERGTSAAMLSTMLKLTKTHFGSELKMLEGLECKWEMKTHYGLI